MGPLTEQERYRFDLQGFLVRRGALAADEVAELRAVVESLELPATTGDIWSQRFKHHLHRHPGFVALLDHPAVLDVLVELCGPDLRLDHAYGIVMDPGQHGLGLHGGATPWDPAQYYVVRDGRIACGLVAVQWALTDHPAGSGGFACIPGSHRSGFPRPPSIGLDDPLVTEVPLSAGDVVIFTEALTHGTRQWQGPGRRLTVLSKYSPGCSSWGRDEVYDESLWPMLTERQRLLFEPPYVAARRPLPEDAEPARGG